MMRLDRSIAPDFGEIIRQRRLDLKEREAATLRLGEGNVFTQDRVAAACGFASGSTISAIERGHRITLLRPDAFWRLGTALQLTPEEMLEAAGYLEKWS